MTDEDAPHVFLSYSWSSEQHESWVLRLAQELADRHVHVIFDKFDLHPGQDAHKFMERSVTDPKVRKVALICDRVYKEKADSRSGGVGTEAQIITPHLYGKTEQTKFVAIIAERDEQDRPHVPAYYGSNLYIDLSSDDLYARNFEQVLRWIFDKPLYLRPELGPKPVFLEDGPTPSSGTSAASYRALDAIRNRRTHALGALREYFDLFAANLERLRIAPQSSDELVEDVISSIETFIPARDEAIAVFAAIAQYLPDVDGYDEVRRFFESIAPYSEKPASLSTYFEEQFDNFRFVILELFLYSVATALREERFDGVAHLVGRRYYVTSVDSSDEGLQDFTLFYSPMRSIQALWNSRQSPSWLSPIGHLLQQRATVPRLPFDSVMQADLVLTLRDARNALNEEQRYQQWYPTTLLYARHRFSPFEIFARAQSREYLGRLQQMLALENLEDAQALFGAFQSGKLNLPRWEWDTPDLSRLAGASRLGQYP